MLIFLAAEAAADSADSMFPPFNPAYWESQAFWLVVSFVVLYVVLSRMILPKVSSTLERRGSRIASDLDEAARLNDEAIAAQKALEIEMAKARASARETAAETQAKIDSRLAAATALADDEINAKLASADEAISTLRTEALARVPDIASETAISAAGRLGLNITEDEAAKAVSTVLKAS